MGAFLSIAAWHRLYKVSLIQRDALAAIECSAYCSRAHIRRWYYKLLYNVLNFRYGFQVAGSLFVFMLFWILLVKVNRSLNTANLDHTDERVFWVSKLL
jgi:hypothetical protein